MPAGSVCKICGEMLLYWAEWTTKPGLVAVCTRGHRKHTWTHKQPPPLPEIWTCLFIYPGVHVHFCVWGCGCWSLWTRRYKCACPSGSAGMSLNSPTSSGCACVRVRVRPCLCASPPAVQPVLQCKFYSRATQPQMCVGLHQVHFSAPTSVYLCVV